MFVCQLFAVPVCLSSLARSCHHGGNAMPSVWQSLAIVVAQYCHYDGKGTGYIVSVNSRYFYVCYIIMYPKSVAVKNSKNNVGKVWSLCFIALLLHPHSRENGASGMMETWRCPWVGDEVGWAKR